MCIICVKKSGVNLPTETVLKTMFENNPDGAGFMFVRTKENDGFVHIRKGYMTYNEFAAALSAEKLTKDDAIVYHFRITTQGGVQQALTHPFPVAHNMDDLKRLRCKAKLGVAHNGVIRITSDGAADYSDTMLFITKYIVNIIRTTDDLNNPFNLDIIEKLANSKFALLSNNGDIKTIGNFNTTKDGLMFSNYSYIENKEPKKWYYSPYTKKWYNV